MTIQNNDRTLLFYSKVASIRYMNIIVSSIFSEMYLSCNLVEHGEPEYMGSYPISSLYI